MSRPLAFEANRGQADEQVQFLARGAGYTVFLTSTEAVLSLRAGRSGRAVVRVKPVGASAAARIVADGELPGVVNYAAVHAGAAPHQRADLRAGALRRRLSRHRSRVLRQPARARVRLHRRARRRSRAASRSTSTAPSGSTSTPAATLLLHTAAGALRQPRPIVYQDDRRRAASGGRRLRPRTTTGACGFRLGAYDASRPLVIDPVLAYSTYLGGSGDESDRLRERSVGIARRRRRQHLRGRLDDLDRLSDHAGALAPRAASARRSS